MNRYFRLLVTFFILVINLTLESQTLVQVINLPNNNFFNNGYGLVYRGGLLWVSSYYSTGNLGARLYAVDTLGNVVDSIIFSHQHVNSSQGLTIGGSEFYFVQRYTARCRIIKISSTGQVLDSLSWPTASSVYLGGLGYDGHIWASVYYPNADAALYKININTSQVIDTIRTFGIQPTGIAIKGDTLFYVMDGFDGDEEKIYAVRISTKDTLFSFRVPEQPSQRQNPRGLAWDGRYLYLLAEPVGASTGRSIFKFDLSGMGNPSINVQTKFFDFGYVIIGTTGEVTATILNQGNAPLRIDSVRFLYSNKFTTNISTPLTINPNSFSNFKIFYTPTAPIQDTASLYIYHNDITRNVQVIRLIGTGTYSSGIISLPTSINFGTKRISSTNLRYLRIDNQGTSPIIISGWTSSKPDYYVETSLPVTIPPNGFVNIKVWFKPNIIGAISDTLILFNNSSNMPQAKVFCTGIGELQNIPLGQPLWVHTIPNHPVSNTFRTVKGVRAINDINNDGKADVIVCTENYWTVALNGNSSGTNDTLWSFNTYISSSSAGSIGSAGDYSYQKALSIASDMNNDGFNDVVIGTGGGNETVYAINGKTGAMLWKFGTDHPDSFSLGDITGVDATTDFNGDGVPDVIAASSAAQTGGVGGRRTVYLFNGINGQIIWQYLIGGFTHGVTAIRDINNDNVPDVIATVGEPQYRFVALSGLNGSFLWGFSVASSTGGAKEVIRFPVSSTREDVIAGAFWGPVYRLNGSNGGMVWQYSTGGSAPTQMKILPDVTGDGVAEVVISLLVGGARCLNGATGELIWSKSTGNTMGVDVVPDLNGDGSNDVIFAVQNQGALIVNGSNGNELALYSFGGNTQAREVAIVPDIDGNGSTEMIVGSNLGNVALLSGGLVITRTIQITSPNGGEVWYWGQTKKIRWVATNITSVKIELSTNNGLSWITIVNSTTAASGEFDWLVGNYHSEQCKIKISSLEDPNVFDLSDSVFTIRNKLCVSFDVQSNWNLVSVPVSRTNMSKSDVFPTATSSAFGFNQYLGYVSFDTLRNGSGYWVKFSQPEQLTLCGLPIENKVILVKGGWNLIGGFNNNVSVTSITTVPPNIIQSYFFGYNAGYFAASTIERGKGYWVKMSQDGELVFPSNLNNRSGKEVLNSFSEFGEIIITDDLNNVSRLYLSDKSKLLFNELPPSPPHEVFDVRFEGNRFISTIDGENTILIQGATYPIRIKSSKYSITVENEFGKINKSLKPDEELIIENSQINSLKIRVNYLPELTNLYQNYPNPFNPVTKIKYDLNQACDVKISIYDLVGREIIQLVNETQNAGSYEIELDANKVGLSSGVYLYRLNAGNYVNTKKLILIK